MKTFIVATLSLLTVVFMATPAQAQEAWDGSRLEFLACEYDPNSCTEIRAGICNRGQTAMTGTSTWEVYYSPTGDPVTEGTVVGSGTIIPLLPFHQASWAACLLVIYNPTYSGNYRFVAYQRPGSPDPTATSDLVVMNACPAPPSPTPSPSSSSNGVGGPVATPTPGPVGKELRLNTDRLICPNTTFDAVADVLDHGKGIGNVKVTFSFNGQTQEAHTNADGRAKVTFNTNASGTLIAKAEGFEDRSHSVVAPVCDEAKKQENAKVLGATTLADTGWGQDYLALMVIGSGFSLAFVSYLGLAGLNRR